MAPAAGEHAPATPGDKARTLEVALLSTVFVGSMLAHEILIEGLWESFRERGAFPDAIGFYITVFQFSFCALGALAVKVLKQTTKEGTLCAGAAPAAAAELPGERAGVENDAKLGGAGAGKGAAVGWARRTLREWWPYVCLSMLVFLSTALANQSVHYVNYVVKVVFKSSKLMPTMLVATLMGNSKRFNALEYLAACLLCLGTAGFAYGSGREEDGKGVLSLLVGCALLLVSITADAFVPNAQQRLMSHHVTPEDLMIKTNTLGAVLLVGAMSVLGQFWACVQFSIAHPMANVNLVLCAVTLFMAVYAMTSLVSRAGSVFAVTVATARKGGTVVLSYLTFPKDLTVTHAAALLAVAAGVVIYEYNNQAKKAAGARDAKADGVPSVRAAGSRADGGKSSLSA